MSLSFPGEYRSKRINKALINVPRYLLTSPILPRSFNMAALRFVRSVSVYVLYNQQCPDANITISSLGSQVISRIIWT